MVARYPGGVAQAVGTAAPRERGAWSADGRGIAYGTRDNTRIALVNLVKQAETFVSVPDSLGTTYGHSILSPDGRQLVVSTIRKWTDWGRLVLVAVDRSSGGRSRALRGVEPIGWTPTGWLYLRNHRALFGETGLIRIEIWRLRVPDGAAEFVAALPDGVDNCSMAQDGLHGACVQPSVQSDLLVVTGSALEATDDGVEFAPVRPGQPSSQIGGISRQAEERRDAEWAEAELRGQLEAEPSGSAYRFGRISLANILVTIVLLSPGCVLYRVSDHLGSRPERSTTVYLAGDLLTVG
jgi:hypothetical protein